MATPPPFYNPATDPQGFFAPPTNLLSRTEFAKKKPGANYKNYRDWVTRTRRRRAGSRQAAWSEQLGPYAGIVGPPGYYQNLAQKTYPIMSEAEMQRRAKEYVTASTGPVIKQITESNASATRTGLSMIQSYAQGAAADLSKIAPEIQAAYDSAISSQSAIDKALTSSIAGEGQAAALDVQGAMANFGASAAESNAGAQGLANMGTGLAVEQGGLYSASLSQLATDKGTEGAYAAKFPAFAIATGQQQVGNFTATQQQALNDAIGEITSQVPGMTQEYLHDLMTNNQNARIGRAGIISGGQSAQLQAAGTYQGALADKEALDQQLTLAREGDKAAMDRTKYSEDAATARNDADIVASTAAATQAAKTKGAEATAKALSAAQKYSIDKIVRPAFNKTKKRPATGGHFAADGETWIPKQGAGTEKIPVFRGTVYKQLYSYFQSQFPGEQPGFYLGQIANAMRAGGYVQKTSISEIAAMMGFKVKGKNLVPMTKKEKQTAAAANAQPEPKGGPGWGGTGTRGTAGTTAEPTQQEKDASHLYTEKQLRNAEQFATQSFNKNIPKAEARQELNLKLTKTMGREAAYAVSGQAVNNAYGKKTALSGTGQSSSGGKFGDKIGPRLTHLATALKPGSKKKYTKGGRSGYLATGEDGKHYFIDQWGNAHLFRG